jgi:hypothetical protein
MSAPEDDPDAVPVPRQIEAAFQNYMPLMELRFGKASIKTTIEHPFWVVGRGWTHANLLVEGDRLRSDDGSTVVLTGTERNLGAEIVYNVTITDYHTYFVGNTAWGFSVWSHNAGSWCSKITSEAAGGKDVLGQTYPGPTWPGTPYDTHGHHILPKVGKGAEQQALVLEGQAILKADPYLIDPVNGLENLIFAPRHGHTTDYCKSVVNAIKECQANGGSRQAMLDVLKAEGQKFIAAAEEAAKAAKKL